MDYPHCQHENDATAAFCEECGASLRAHTCVACGAELKPSAKFCPGCGTAVRAGVGSLVAGDDRRADARHLVPDAGLLTPKHLAEKVSQSKSALEGERKQVTVLFADICGSMELAEKMDPEEWSQIMQRFFRVLQEGVERFEGFVDKFTGDGIMGLFGAPIAHEDHAQRACYAALQLQKDLRHFSGELQLPAGLELSVRMGINSGEVVVGRIGDDLRMEYTAQGHTVGLAARMERLAPAHGVCVSEATAGLVSGYVELRERGAEKIKGVSAPVLVFELEGFGELQTRFDQSRARGLTRFVGRDADMAVLERTLDQAGNGSGQVVGVVAEAGTGKSRLCFEFVARCRASGLTVLQGSAVAHGRNIPFLPILQIFRQYFGVSEQDSHQAARNKIGRRLLSIDASLRELLPAVFDFMAVPDTEHSMPTIDPDVRRRQLFGVWRKVLEHGNAPIVTFIEDLHWLDAGSEAWLEQMVDAVARSNTLLLVNFRPEFHAAWMQKSWYRQLPLLPLSPESIRELLGDMLGTDQSITGLADAVHERTAGNPFFAEEIVQNLIESGSLKGRRGAYRLVTPVAQLEVPGTVQSVLAARIDRLGERDKQALQAASVVGREFSEPILSAVLDWPVDDLSKALQALKNAEFLYERSPYPVTEYAFKHPLTQEVALGSQLRERRARTHAAVARALETAHAGHLDEQASVIAHHYDEADETLQAARWHRRAASWLLARDFRASAVPWKRVYDLAGSTPATPETMELRLEACGRLVMTSHLLGIPEDERDRLAAEGRELAERLGDRVRLFLLEASLTISQILGGWSKAPIASTQHAIEMAEDLDLGLEMKVLARVNLHSVLLIAGRTTDALRVADEALELAAGDLELGVTVAGFSVPNLALFGKAQLLMWQGRPREAAECYEQSRKVAAARNEMILCQIVAMSGAPFDELTGISKQTLERGRQAVEQAESTGDFFTQAFTLIYLGLGQLMHGQVADALVSLRAADHLQRERGLAGNLFNLGQGLIAEAYLAAGDTVSARAAADRCTVDRDTWVYELRAHLSRSRVLRALDGANARADVEASLARAQLLLENSGARAFAPLIIEERARLAAVLDDDAAAGELLREAHRLFGEVEATGHVERLAKEIGC